MNRRRAWLVVLLAVLLVCAPLLVESGSVPPQPEAFPVHAALPDLLRAPHRVQLSADAPLPAVSLPVPAPHAAKPFLLALLCAVLKLILRRRVVTAQSRATAIDPYTLQSYTDHPRHAPPVFA